METLIMPIITFIILAAILIIWSIFLNSKNKEVSHDDYMIEFIRFLRIHGIEDIFYKYSKIRKDEIKRMLNDTQPHMFLFTAFNWHKTKEKFDFWNIKNEEWLHWIKIRF